MPAVNRIRRRDWLLLLIVLFIAASMRLGEPGIIEFKHDEAWLSLKALDLANGMDFPFTGISSSVGVPNPPISVYILALPYLFTNNPVVVTMFIAALNVIGVGLLWLIAYRYINRNVALIAGLAYAMNPWAVLYSRKIWAQDFHTPFFLLALLLGLHGFIENKKWAQIACLPILMIALQIHFAAWVLLPLYGWLIWIGFRRKTLSWWAIVVSAVLALLTLIPYAIGLSQTDPNILRWAADNSDSSLELRETALTFTVQLASGLGLETQVAPLAQEALLANVPPQTQLWVLLGVITLAGVILMRTAAYRHMALVLVLWALLPLLIFTVAWTGIFPHYFIASLPAYAILAAISIDWLMRRAPGQPISQTILLTACCFILLTQALWWRGLLRYVDTTYTEYGFSTALHHLMAVRAELLDDQDVLLLADNAFLDFSETPAVWSVLLYDRERCVRALDDQKLLIFPQGSFTAVWTPSRRDSVYHSLYQNDQPHPITIRPENWRFTIYRLDPLTPAMTFTPLEALQFDNGVRLDGFTVARDEVLLSWKLPSAQLDDYHYFIHLLDANGERIVQHDTDFLQGRFWCAGDQVITWADMSVPPETATLRVGLYHFGTGNPFISAHLVDDAGNAGTPWADIPLESSEN